MGQSRGRDQNKTDVIMMKHTAYPTGLWPVFEGQTTTPEPWQSINSHPPHGLGKDTLRLICTIVYIQYSNSSIVAIRYFHHKWKCNGHSSKSARDGLQ